jgi:uncharacterized protein (TIGR01777 family)
MLPAFRWFVGGALGDGHQWFPWIHIQDLVRAVDFLADHHDLHGPFNVCAPNPVRNKEMTRALAAALGRPAKMAVPAWAIRTVAGEMADALLGSQRALPTHLLEAGFEFAFPELSAALDDLITAG